MNRLSRALSLLLAATCLAACSHLPIIGKKKPDDPSKSKSSHLASDTENEFRKRWVDKRVAELIGQGVAPDVARSQATHEFSDKYSVTNAAHQ